MLPSGCWQFAPGSAAFSKSSLYIWKFLAYVLLKPSLKDKKQQHQTRKSESRTRASPGRLLLLQGRKQARDHQQVGKTTPVLSQTPSAAVSTGPTVVSQFPPNLVPFHREDSRPTPYCNTAAAVPRPRLLYSWHKGKPGESANAVPHYHKLCSRVSHIWGNRRGQHIRSAMDKPRPGKTTCVIMVSPLPGKYEFQTCRPTSTSYTLHFTHMLTLLSTSSNLPRPSTQQIHALSSKNS